MKGLVIFFCLFYGCHVAGATGKTIMLFPQKTDTDYVTLKPTERVLNQITVCLKSYTELIKEHSLFSLAMQGSGKDNTLLIYPYPPNNISISIHNEDIYFKVDPEVLQWKRTCVTWDSKTGLLQLWINGKLYPRRITKSRSPIGPQISVILGQEQDSYGGSFDINQAFVGEMSDVNVWDYVLPPENIKAYFSDDYTLDGNFYSWDGGNYTINGLIVVLRNQFIPKL
uniref:Jeltraxin n=1 Tax=Lepidobatrachus laevis TaxID=8376 RepID=JELT_LEPLA|nr:RecName: Full=Jeltraxin; AltName: Full=Egg jelly pentraxin; Flags: Precursor [Lepidobatrachus laevis]AAF21665.1 egg jelly pentraxin precursor [Lepidobatrachus laevis]